MKIAELAKQRIAVVGLGSENFALLNFIYSKNYTFPITIFAFQSRQEMEKHYPSLKKWKHISWVISKPNFKQLKSYSLVLKSPGAFFSPQLRKQLKKSGVKITSAMQLFLDLCPTKNIIGVTGTKGKGTTSSLVEAIIKKAGKRVWLGGNIGVAPFSFIHKIKKSDWVILELSSFQLEDTTSSPHISVLTNFSAEHLAPADKNNPNYHPSLNHYWQSKLNLLRFQGKNDIAIINIKLQNKINNNTKAKKIFFTTSTLPSKLPGDHNKENIAAAVAVAKAIKISEKIINQAVKDFKGLPYRLEKITEKNRVAYYNDSFATTPSATITALKAFNNPIILIAGGADKGSDFNQLARIIKQKTKTVILFKGTALKKLETSLNKAKCNHNNIKVAGNMAEAINLARKQSTPGDIILMSPACASFGLFKNYKDRGEQFNKSVIA
jgi:UDP-N-acetylmuramoylalanine--D-glutamate ligase